MILQTIIWMWSTSTVWTLAAYPETYLDTWIVQYTLREFTNSTSSPVGYASEEVSNTQTRIVAGSSNQSPPWTAKFATLFSQQVTFETEIPAGTCPAFTLRKWILKWDLEDGKETWVDGSQDPPSEYRTRVYYSYRDFRSHDYFIR